MIVFGRYLVDQMNHSQLHVFENITLYKERKKTAQVIDKWPSCQKQKRVTTPGTALANEGGNM